MEAPVSGDAEVHVEVQRCGEQALLESPPETVMTTTMARGFQLAATVTFDDRNDNATTGAIVRSAQA